eukprot:CAMPEP_0184399966 /NCGR_PEP_ID=MMETSP0007-20130409/72644_1 /TAXON_ID=97485 /ORGANISM="Prymnesium parvum, Strain Texoma1" /LENGTH=50 /DNA_ID=CAMNT_0026754639 /DNA_START=67 /DNA_END=215 /DNA_ORIENTATION=+
MTHSVRDCCVSWAHECEDTRDGSPLFCATRILMPRVRVLSTFSVMHHLGT